jgi:hypothetical protein
MIFLSCFILLMVDSDADNLPLMSGAVKDINDTYEISMALQVHLGNQPKKFSAA